MFIRPTITDLAIKLIEEVMKLPTLEEIKVSDVPDTAAGLLNTIQKLFNANAAALKENQRLEEELKDLTQAYEDELALSHALAKEVEALKSPKTRLVNDGFGRVGREVFRYNTTWGNQYSLVEFSNMGFEVVPTDTLRDILS